MKSIFILFFILILVSLEAKAQQTYNSLNAKNLTASVMTLSGLTASLPVKTNASKELVSSAIDLSGSEVTSTLPIGKGGTGATSLAGANIVTNAGASHDNCIFTADSTTGKIAQCNSSSTILTDTGRFGVGTVSPSVAIQIEGTNGATSGLSATRTSDDTQTGYLVLGKARTATPPLTNDTVGAITLRSRNGVSGTAIETLMFQSIATENHSASATGKDIRLYTVPDTTNTATERVRIGQDGTFRVLNLTASMPVQTDALKNLISSAINLSSAQVTSTLPLAKGGSNKNMTASAGAIIYSDSDSLEASAVGISGQLLKSNGAAAPTWVNGSQSSDTVITTGVTGPVIYSFKGSTTGVVSQEVGDIINGNCAVSGTSIYTCTFNSIWSTAPNCIVVAQDNAARSARIYNAPSTTTLVIRTQTPGSDSVDTSNFHVICHGVAL